MLLRQMRYFVAVVDCRSFTEAAEQCFISQSAISQQIRSLERELGVDLIQRKNRRFAVTPAGQYFYSRSREILKQTDDLVREMKSRGEDRGPSLRIGYLRCYSGLELYQALRHFPKSIRKWIFILSAAPMKNFTIFSVTAKQISFSAISAGRFPICMSIS